MNTIRTIAIAVVGIVALGVGAGCTSFWAASAPDAEPKQDMEEPTPIEDDTEVDDAQAEAPDETDDTDADTEPGAGEGDYGGMGTTGSDSGADTETSAEKKPKTPMKMTVASTAPKTAKADFYWDVEKNTAMGTRELKVQLVAADSGAELKACREVKVSAGTQSFMGERVGIEVEERTERLTAYLPKDALDKLAAAKKVNVFVCEYEFGLKPAQTKKFADLKASETKIESESKPATDDSDAETGSSMDDDMDDAVESDDMDDAADSDNMDSDDSAGVESSDSDY